MPNLLNITVISDPFTNIFTVFVPANNTIKQCALIAVDEIIKDLKESLKVAEDLHLHARGLIIGSFVDWQEVKTEIEKL